MVLHLGGVVLNRYRFAFAFAFQLSLERPTNGGPMNQDNDTAYLAGLAGLAIPTHWFKRGRSERR